MPSQIVVGIDVATAQWDMALRPTGERGALTHAGAGIAGLVPRLQAIAPQRMVLEAPGSGQRAVVAALVAAGLPVAGITPRHARDVAKATGPWAQTEALDARAFAPIAEAVRPLPRPLPDPHGRRAAGPAGASAAIGDEADRRTAPPGECAPAAPA
jgi:transposase